MPKALLTTQPGWAFATLAELRSRGVGERAELFHRDSTVVLPAEALDVRAALLTTAETCGVLAEGYARGGWDASRALVDALWRAEVARGVTWWLGGSGGLGGPGSGKGRGRFGGQGAAPRRRTWTVVAEVWGETQVHRRPLADAVRQAMRAAFPRWDEAPYDAAANADVRLVVKADTRAALVGVQLATNLEPGQGSRPGALRHHLACGLLVICGLAPSRRASAQPSRSPQSRPALGPIPGPALGGATVIDPFAGSGTILEAAGRHFGATQLIGAEIERGVARQARQRLRTLTESGVDAEVHIASFEMLEGQVPEGAYLVSNLPFGERFTQVETRRLLSFLDSVAPRLAGIALLTSREQASPIAERVGLRIKNVIVLGQPAAITYGVRQRIQSKADNGVRRRR